MLVHTHTRVCATEQWGGKRAHTYMRALKGREQLTRAFLLSHYVWVWLTELRSHTLARPSSWSHVSQILKT